MLRPGGIAFLTFHSERSWLRIKDLSFVFSAILECWHENGERVDASDFDRPMPADRLVLTWRTSSSYRCNVFHSIGYVRRAGGASSSRVPSMTAASRASRTSSCFAGRDRIVAVPRVRRLTSGHRWWGGLDRPCRPSPSEKAASGLSSQ